jgi:hypothetical protein
VSSRVPNINANATVLAGALSTIIIYLASLPALGGTTVPGAVGSAVTTLLAVLFGIGFGMNGGTNGGATK